jgi:hypothetical protein
MKPNLKPPGSKRSKLECDILLSSYAFKFNLRRYIQAIVAVLVSVLVDYIEHYGLTRAIKTSAAGAYTRSQFSST